MNLDRRPTLVPELLVTDLAASLRFWVGLCGFKVVYDRLEEGFAYIRCGAAAFMLDEVGVGRSWITAPLDLPLGRGVNFEISVPTIEPVLGRLADAAWPLFLAPEEKWYRVDGTQSGVRQFLLQDPDGYLLRFSCPLAPAPASAQELLDAYDGQLRQVVPTTIPPSHSYEFDGAVMRITGQHRGFISTARDVGVTGVELDRTIEQQRDFFAIRGEAVEWKTRGHDLPADLTERLARAGFLPEERETVLVGESAALAVDSPLPDSITIRNITEREDLIGVASLQEEIWGEDLSWLADDLGQRLAADREHFVVTVAETDGRIVSAAWLVLPSGSDFAGLWGGSTLAAWRRRGIYRALVAHRAQIARSRGVRFLQVDASDDSRPILERLGFVAITTTTPWVWTPAE